MKDNHVLFDEWNLDILDQTLLPAREERVICDTTPKVANAIATMQVRGAPLIGVVAAYGLAIASREASPGSFGSDMARAAQTLAQTRPTAVNLFWAIDRMMRVAREVEGLDHESRCCRMRDEAVAIHREDVEMCRTMGRHGAALIQDGETIMTQ